METKQHFSPDGRRERQTSLMRAHDTTVSMILQLASMKNSGELANKAFGWRRYAETIDEPSSGSRFEVLYCDCQRTSSCTLHLAQREI